MVANFTFHKQYFVLYDCGIYAFSVQREQTSECCTLVNVVDVSGRNL